MTLRPKNRTPKSNEPSTAGGRERRLKARPPARFSSLRSLGLVNQKQEPSGNTLLAQRYPSSGNSYFWRTTTLAHVTSAAASERTSCGALTKPSVENTSGLWLWTLCGRCSAHGRAPFRKHGGLPR